MVALSKYEEAASAFLEKHPVGTIVPPDRMVKWAHDHGNGLAPDLLIDDPSKRLSALRRHLNHGGASRNLTEDERFYLAIEDKERKTLLVQSLVDYTREKADVVFDKSINGAMNPLKKMHQQIDDHKLEELSPETREELEQRIKELVDAVAPLRTLLSQQNIDRHAKRLEAKGYTAKQARDLLELMPQFSRFTKLQKVINN
jgi:DNA-binding transcriptional ArsR family regulator